MRRIIWTPHSREYCERRALDYAWLSENTPCPGGAARAWDLSRYWRSLALVAAPPARLSDKAQATPEAEEKPQRLDG